MTPNSSTDSATRDGILQKLAEAAKSTARRRDGVVCGILTVACCNKMEAERDALIDQLAREADTLLAASRAEVERLRAVGGLMANTMFNLGQHDGHVLTKDECRLFRVMQRDWDAALSTKKD